ncbi:hypothetical protein PUR61_19560 [Streptomyces sp. BE20]|uniref:hypothetical protein n=1 Tax=Streptomyces sp. BE20 TaxID=3002525 RepID=UPI002E7A6E9D|nr:hypothetical protein [Streptomyces sp. BE20]MEE1824355.1 hypothetical protein [Streptomyces sp. BE20]
MTERIELTAVVEATPLSQQGASEEHEPEPGGRSDLPAAPTEPPPAAPAAPAEAKAGPVPRGQVAGKEKVQPYITTAVAEAARNAVVATTPYEGGYQSLSDLIEDAIVEKVAKLQRTFNEGNPFPERPRKRIRTGRPLGR